jgi:DNA polymerase-4
MNAFFAEVEQSRNPRLRGQPVAVIGSGKRTLITTASYEARQFGIQTRMTVPEARQRCPGLQLVVGNNQRYADTCTRLTRLYHQYTSRVEVFSIDECFLDLTGIADSPEFLRPVALEIKQRIRDRFRLRCSIGLAPNKLLAKLASDMQKPDGLVIIREPDISGLMENLSVDRLCGIGSKMAEHLLRLGITTCGQLGRASVHLLKARFGIVGEYLHDMAQGTVDSPVITLPETPADKSVGHTMTLERNVTDRSDMERCLLQLSEMVGRRLRRNHFTGRTLALTVRYEDFTTFTRRRTLGELLYNSFDIYLVAREILRSLRIQKPVRLLGVAISSLGKHALQLPLFEKDRKRMQLTAALDAINNKFGDYTVTWASLARRAEGPSVISPSWRPAGAKWIDLKETGS